MMNLFLLCLLVYYPPFTTNNLSRRKWRFLLVFFPGFSFCPQSYFFDMQNKEFSSFLHHSARKFIPLWNHKSNRFLFLFFCPRKTFGIQKYKSRERSVIYIRLTTGWDKSSIQLRCFIMSMRITLNSWIIFCHDTILILPSSPPEVGKTHQVGKFNKEKKNINLFYTCNEAWYPGISGRTPPSEKWCLRRNFKASKFSLELERMFDHFLPEDFSRFSPYREVF